jgi:hypothetical protein
VLSTLIAGLGFGGFHHPWGIVGGKFTELTNGHQPLFLSNSGNRVPLAETEAEFVPSIIGCGCVPSTSPPFLTPLIFYFIYNIMLPETIVTVLKFEHRERAEILVQTAFFFFKKKKNKISIPFLSNFVSIVSVTTGNIFSGFAWTYPPQPTRLLQL